MHKTTGKEKQGIKQLTLQNLLEGSILPGGEGSNLKGP